MKIKGQKITMTQWRWWNNRPVSKSSLFAYYQLSSNFYVMDWNKQIGNSKNKKTLAACVKETSVSPDLIQDIFQEYSLIMKI